MPELGVCGHLRLSRWKEQTPGAGDHANGARTKWLQERSRDGSPRVRKDEAAVRAGRRDTRERTPGVTERSVSARRRDACGHAVTKQSVGEKQNDTTW